MIITTVGQGLIMSILGIGLFLTYRILDFPDMTTEGSFPLGGVVSVTAITYGVSPLLATFLGILAGSLAGLMTALLYTKGKIPVLLSGVLVMTSLHSVMLFIMQKASISLYHFPHIFEYGRGIKGAPSQFELIVIGVVALTILIGLITYFFQTDLGQAYVVTGDNEVMARAMGIQTNRMKTLGLMLSNGIVALSGSLMAQSEGYASLNKGIGVIVIGLASILIGEMLFQELNFTERLLAVVVGSIIYQCVIITLIKLGVNTNYLKIFSSGILTMCLLFPMFQKKVKGGMFV
ncbi:ABC transporter permease [Vagococcus humatus]|uniref:Branched-chain amino acid ABC transporter permease n=1 Tax=Vagococcus humatus TaxID=1889241 RepID=A0A3S0ACG7_9ENTE|nr:ABC transporter permease [Vagococcus humatus]RST88547.1 branched-chain amino acid ABC transporter permease [Vagococcus humatus]